LIEQVVRAAIIAIGIAIVGAPPATVNKTTGFWPRDTWYAEDIVLDDQVDKVVGVASWYDASKNNAWYTVETQWGKPVKFYAAAGPELRRFIEDFYETDIGGSGYWQRLAEKDKRPRLRITSKKTGESVVVIVTDWCGCHGGSDGKQDDKIIDLAPAVFDALGVPLESGIMKVTIEPVK